MCETIRIEKNIEENRRGFQLEPIGYAAGSSYYYYYKIIIKI